MEDYLEKYLKKENDSIVQLCNKITDKQMDFTNEILNINIKNTIKSHDCLIEQKKEAISQTTQRIDILSIKFDDEEFDVTTHPKSLLEKQNEEIEKFKKDIESLTELHNVLMDSETSNMPKRVSKNLQSI